MQFGSSLFVYRFVIYMIVIFVCLEIKIGNGCCNNGAIIQVVVLALLNTFVTRAVAQYVRDKQMKVRRDQDNSKLGQLAGAQLEG